MKELAGAGWVRSPSHPGGHPGLDLRRGHRGAEREGRLVDWRSFPMGSIPSGILLNSDLGRSVFVPNGINPI